MATKKKTTSPSRVKKKWVPISAPEILNGASLGESYLVEGDLLKDRHITANMSTITGNMRKNSVNMQFKIIAVKDGKAETRTMAYSMINSAIKRLVKRGRDKISDSFLAKTKDREVVRIKPLIISSTRGTKSVQSAIRLETRRVIREYAFTVPTETLFSDIFNGKIQKMVKEQCVKFTPLKNVDIRMAKLEENAKVVVTEGGVKTESVKRRIKDVEGKRHTPEDKLDKVEPQESGEAPEDETEFLEPESADEDSEEFGEESALEKSEEQSEDSDETAESEESDDEEKNASKE
ncbi:MAG: hypothetical protein ACOCU6_00100 [Nanoarchaeota archaeon]